MHSTECVVIKLLQPTERKAEWLDKTAQAFGEAVQMGLDTAQNLHTSSRAKIHQAAYYPIRQQCGLPSDYARMAVNASVSLARSYYGTRKSKLCKRPSFPKVNGSQGIGLGVNAYALTRSDSRWVLRVSTGTRGAYLWFPLCVPQRYQERMAQAQGAARLFKRDGNWYAALPVRVSPAPAGCSGESTYIGVDLGIVRLATVVTPNCVVFFNGKPARHKREHFADLRRRYGQAHRVDRIKTSKGKESRWMYDLNHQVSRQIVNLAMQYPNPVIVLERLDGIRYRAHGSKRFNRMMASWAFHDLVAKITYKAAREGIPVVFVDPRKTSQTCPKCGYAARSNRTTQALFRCVACGFTANADYSAGRNIAARGPMAYEQGPTDTARPDMGQTENISFRPDVASNCDSVHPSHNQTTTFSSSGGTSPL